MNAYLDASAIIPILIEEPASDAIDAFAADRAGSLVISDFTAAEVASALSIGARTGRLTQDTAMRYLADFDTWRAVMALEVDITSSDTRLANIFVRRFDLMLRAPDALHAAICQRTGHQLVTLDLRLASAAQALGLEVLIPA
ncbi:type II toxin-antitoxin system VapC family toxin [Phenylobacterium aquaticum]|uniref:type II toxin-antitoxin system VapC family toxin n=1 Tax=Phenylobacterium aquaticum TaxID=1763816 RepID=UPI0026F3187D|nr:type II toxin-antitoxin system VapC family toxin [Phenylobacterium aquaticum]